MFYQDNAFVERIRQLGVEVWLWDDVVPGEFERGRQRRHLIGKLTHQTRAVRDRVAFLRRVRADLVHMNNSPIAGIDDWLPAARWLRIPCTAHSRSAVGPRSFLHETLLKGFDRIIAVSDHVAETVEAAGYPSARLTRIYDGVDVAGARARVRRSAEDVRAEFGVAPSAFLVVMVGHLRAWKGQDTLLEAVARLPDDVRERTTVLIVGEAPPSDRAFLARVERLRAELRLEQRVVFTGYRADAIELMNAADVVVHASTIPEPFGLVVVEAMALGRAVIASSIGGPAETVLPGTGLLFDPNDSRALADRLTEVARDPALRDRLGAGGRARAQDFDIAPCVTAVDGIFRAVLEARSGARGRRA